MLQGVNQDPPLSHFAYDTMLLLSSTIHVHHRHLLIILHVNDCFTTLSTIGFCRSSRFLHCISPFTVCSSVNSPSLRVSALSRNDRLSLFFSPSFSPGIPFFYLCRVVLSLSQLHVTVATPGPLVRTTLSTTYLIHHTVTHQTAKGVIDNALILRLGHCFGFVLKDFVPDCSRMSSGTRSDGSWSLAGATRSGVRRFERCI